jgi:hypothetical protein
MAQEDGCELRFRTAGAMIEAKEVLLGESPG